MFAQYIFCVHPRQLLNTPHLLHFIFNLTLSSIADELQAILVAGNVILGLIPADFRCKRTAPNSITRPRGRLRGGRLIGLICNFQGVFRPPSCIAPTNRPRRPRFRTLVQTLSSSIYQLSYTPGGKSNTITLMTNYIKALYARVPRDKPLFWKTNLTHDTSHHEFNK